MNANEVIANRAAELLGGKRGDKRVHPNDHVNHGQSSNDVIPTALHVAALEQIERELVPALRELQEALAAKAAAFHDVLKIGARTSGCHPDPAGPGIQRVCQPNRTRIGAPGRFAAAPGGIGAGRHGGGHGNQHASGVRPAHDRGYGRGNAARASRGVQIILKHRRRAMRRGDKRRIENGCGQPDQNRERYPLAWIRPAAAGWVSYSSRRPSRARRSCRAKSIPS